MKIGKIKELLKENKLRVTQSRIAVSEVMLSNSKKYLTPEEIFQKIQLKKNVSCDQVSVYRILAKYEEIGIVKKSEFNKDAARYILNDSEDGKKKHEHFFKCIKCFSIEPFSDCFISKKEKQLEALGYSNLSHHLEITGYCPSCSAR